MFTKEKSFAEIKKFPLSVVLTREMQLKYEFSLPPAVRPHEIENSIKSWFIFPARLQILLLLFSFNFVDGKFCEGDDIPSVITFCYLKHSAWHENDERLFCKMPEIFNQSGRCLNKTIICSDGNPSTRHCFGDIQLQVIEATKCEAFVALNSIN